MTTGPVRADAGWLALREPADAACRSVELVDRLRPEPTRGRTVIHDLGCGTGSMARWLAPRLAGPQRWVLYDRDAEVLPLAEADPPHADADGAAVIVETRHRDITRLGTGELADASLITASALLDMMTAAELARFVASCTDAGCPVLVTLTVTGRVDLTPADAADRMFMDAFNDHQRRPASDGPRLGPDAVDHALAAFAGTAYEVLTRPSPWRLGPDEPALTTEWLNGWVGPACEQRPELEDLRPAFVRRRLAELAEGRLSVTVHHQDMLVLPA